MRGLLIFMAVLLLLICTAISSFIAGASYEKRYHERKKLDKIVNCLNRREEDRSYGNEK